MFPKSNIDYKYKFLQRDNPKLLEVLKSITAKRKELDKGVKQRYEERSANISNLGSVEDEINAKSAADKKPVEEKKTVEVKKQVDEKVAGTEAKKRTMLIIYELLTEYKYDQRDASATDRNYVLVVTQGTTEYDDSGEIKWVDISMKIGNLELTVTDRGLIEGPKGEQLKATAENILILGVPSGHKLKTLIEGATKKKQIVGEDDLKQVSNFLLKEGLFTIPTQDNRIQTIMTTPSPTKLQMLQRGYIQGQQRGKGLKLKSASYDDFVSRLEVLIGSRMSGNNSNEVRKEIMYIVQELKKKKMISAEQEKRMLQNYA